MRKPAGVIAAAVVMGLMAALGTLAVSLSLVVFLFMHNPVNIPGFRAIVVLANLLVLGFFLFSGWTVVGLFRMRPWARVAGVAVGVVVCLFSGGAGFGMLAVRSRVPVLPPPPGEPATILSSLPMIFAGVAVAYCAIALVGLWWAVYFCLPKVREAFTGAGLMVTNPEIVPHGGSVTIAPAGGGAVSGWRVVILAYAGVMLLGVLSLPVVMLMHLPLFFFGAIVSGGAALAALAVMAALQIVLGIGLIRKWKFAWYLGMAWLLYGVAYTLAFLLPGMWDKFIAYQESLTARWTPPGIPDMTTSIYHGPLGVICFGLGILLFLLFAVALFRCKDDYLSV